MMNDVLKGLGFTEGRVIETLLVTESEEGFNCAPIGVWSEGGYLWSKVHEDSESYKNLSVESRCTANIVDVGMLVEGLFTDLDITGGVVDGAGAVLRLAVVGFSVDGEWGLVKYSVDGVEVFDSCARGLCRAELCLLESAVHASRVGLDNSHVGFIGHYREIIDKTGGRSEVELIDRLISNYGLDVE
ncbi:hypothetical protein AMET1_1428 [Methanonatronarchaeum thermophilum]|uniref:DUF447 family protein n=1 Tax=Methanonatronarchaeum thermophilum TaxID=1927129 RepID=A0A1Y3GAS0_9EURY|nr:DUF447 domain-containing protein [Methanonatronarchaeum thermophilum]OUJ18509.1 hypothetical protein AMET1_1428 [Methanonatronarchaeum thermophilum]